MPAALARAPMSIGLLCSFQVSATFSLKPCTTTLCVRWNVLLQRTAMSGRR